MSLFGPACSGPESLKTIEQLSMQVQRLETKVETSSEPEVRDAEAERPPHY